MNICAVALMILVPSHSVPITGDVCAPTGYTRAWRELIKPAAIAEVDTRYGLTKGGPLNGLSARQTEWLSKVTGHVICPGGKGLKGRRGSGALIGRNDLIVTNAHVVRNDDGSARADWGRCYFETQSVPPVRRSLKFGSGTVFGTSIPDLDRDLDHVFIRLGEPIPGVQPIAMATGVADLKAGQDLLMISAVQDKVDPDRISRPNEPIIQSFKVEDLIPSKNDRGMVAYTNASATGGSSGSIVLMRESTGKLVAVGIHARGASRSLDGQKYDPTADTGNHSFSLLFDGPMVRDFRSSLAS